MKRGSLAALLLGMWAMTQVNVIGFLGISELVIYSIAPYVFMKNWPMFKKDGMGTLFALLFLTMIGCFVSGWYNQNSFIGILKGFATIYGFFACITVIYPMLRNNPGNIKWILLGLAISSVICVFVFQPGSAYVGAINDRLSLQESVMSYALFWPIQINTWTTLPIKAAYLHMPTFYALAVPIANALYALISTSSGRSSFLVGMFGVLLLLMAGKTTKRLRLLKKRFIGLVVTMLVGGLVFATVYKYTAKHGFLGEAAQTKYEMQVISKGHGEGLLSIIMGGRIEFFIGATACLKHPILGCGPHAEDKEGLIDYFFEKYGTYEDLEMLQKKRQSDALAGIYYRTIPAHSHIITFWLWYGIVGAILWTYILILFVKTLKNWLGAIPQWVGYFALMLPSATFAVLFSPFGDRVSKAILVCACFVAKNIVEGRVVLPPDMIDEIKKYDK